MDTNTQNQEESILTWKAPTRQAHEHSRRWYIIAGTVMLLLLIYSIFTKAWSFTVVIVLATAVYLFVHKTQPEEKTISIRKKGVLFGEEFIPWIDLKGFWLIQTPDYIELHIEHKKRRKREIVISTGDTDIHELRTTLGQFLTEYTNRNEKILDTISRVCKL